MVSSRDLWVWPNGVRLSYKQLFPCGHIVTVWSNETGAKWPFNHHGKGENEAARALRNRVKAMGCIKCVEPKEPVDYVHKGRGGFLRNLRERIS